MLTDQELMRIKRRAEHLLTIGKTHGQNSIIYKVLEGDARDVLSLLDEIMDMRRRMYKMRSSDFKLITNDEIKVLLRRHEGGDNGDT